MPKLILAFVLSIFAATDALGQNVCAILSGASIVANDGTYLGKIENQYAVDSVLNEYGTYGSEYSVKSIWNTYGQYGGSYSLLSPFNSYTITPPAIVKQGEIIAYLTLNRSIRGALNPYVLKSCAT